MIIGKFYTLPYVSNHKMHTPSKHAIKERKTNQNNAQYLMSHHKMYFQNSSGQKTVLS